MFWHPESVITNAAVTCEQNYFSLRRRPSEIFLFPRVELLEIISEAYCGSRIFSNKSNVTEIISELSAATIMLFWFQTWLHVK